MLRSLKELDGYAIETADKGLSSLQDILFHDKRWIIHYLVVDVKRWFPSRKVLIPPSVINKADFFKNTIFISLTKDQIKASPDITEDQPVYMQKDSAAHLDESDFENIESIMKKLQGDPHLRSVNEVIGYDIHAKDGNIGQIVDFIADDETWLIRFYIVDTGKWIPGKKVILAPDWIERISWEDRNIFVDLEKEAVRNSPEFNPDEQINREYETVLYDYYGRPYYW